MIGVWIGFMLAGSILGWGLAQHGHFRNLFNVHGVTIVLGGTLAAAMINCPFGRLLSSFANFAKLFLPTGLTNIEDIITEVVRLAKKAQVEGGLLSLQEESPNFARGFLHHAILIAIATGETGETRKILESEIRQLRVSRHEDANVFRTIGVLFPMFGLLGTLLGMIEVLESISDPAKAGPAMATALSSAFIGISMANLICVPVAGQIRLKAMHETLVFEMIIEGALLLAVGKTPYIIELHLASYSQRRRKEMEAMEVAEAPRPVAAVGRG